MKWFLYIPPRYTSRQYNFPHICSSHITRISILFPLQQYFIFIRFFELLINKTDYNNARELLFLCCYLRNIKKVESSFSLSLSLSLLFSHTFLSFFVSSNFFFSSHLILSYPIYLPYKKCFYCPTSIIHNSLTLKEGDHLCLRESSSILLVTRYKMIVKVGDTC